MKIGYALAAFRSGVPLGYQITALKRDGCAFVFRDSLDAGPDRPGLIDALCSVATLDVMVFFDINTLGRTIEELGWLIASLGKRRVGLKTLHGRLVTPVHHPRFARLLELMQKHGAAA